METEVRESAEEKFQIPEVSRGHSTQGKRARQILRRLDGLTMRKD